MTVVLDVPDTTQCFRPPNLPHTEVDLYKDANGIVAIYTCLPGYYFASGGTIRTVFCMETEWSHDIPDCERTSCLLSYA